MNLHICTNDKFLSAFIRNQESYAPQSENKYYIIVSGDSKQQFTNNIMVEQPSIKDLKNKLTANLKPKYTHIFCHSLPGKFRKHILPLIPEEIPITWIFYGYEYYHRRDRIVEYLSPVTRKYYRSWKNPNHLWNFALYLVDILRNEKGIYKNDLKRITRFAHWNYAEYELIKSKIGLDRMEFTPFSMGLPIQSVVPDSTSKYLLLGHSGALSVNHLDGIEGIGCKFLEKFERVIIPISYGANKYYQEIIRKVAKAKMGEKAIVIDKFLDRPSYFNLLSKVKLAWMPHIRGMAGGNVLFCLKNNIPLAFPSNSVMYKFFTAHGFNVFNMDQSSLFLPVLSDEQKIENQNALEHTFGVDIIRRQYRDLLLPL